MRLGWGAGTSADKLRPFPRDRDETRVGRSLAQRVPPRRRDEARVGRRELLTHPRAGATRSARRPRTARSPGATRHFRFPTFAGPDPEVRRPAPRVDRDRNHFSFAVRLPVAAGGPRRPGPGRRTPPVAPAPPCGVPGTGAGTRTGSGRGPSAATGDARFLAAAFLGHTSCLRAPPARPHLPLHLPAPRHGAG